MTRSYPEAVDVAIVGSGPNGAAYARILSEEAPDAVIAMFEVGPTVSEPAGAHVKNIEDPDRRHAAQAASQGPAVAEETLDGPAVAAGSRMARAGTFLLEDGFRFEGEDGLPVAAFSSNVGGMGAHWTGACPRPGGAERIGFLPDLDELLDEAGRLLGVTTDAFDAAPFTALVRERLAAAVDDHREPWARVQRMPLAVHRREDGRLVWSGSDVVLGDVTRDNRNFALHDESLVTRVLLEGGRAAGVEVRDLRSGRTHTVRARFVVVAADGLRTAQVLYASDIRPAALGRMLNDQSQVVYAARIRDAAAELAASAATTVDGTIDEQGVVDGALSEQSGVSWVPYTDEEPFHGQIMQLDASPVPLADEDELVPGSIVGLGLFTAKDLQWDDRVDFSDEDTDAYGMPAMRIHYRLTPRDHEVLDRARQRIVELAEVVGEPLGDRPFTMPPGASLHYQGATRMGETDDGRSVCGPDSEVWQAPGVFVAGNNVIPTPTACNPTLTSVALAVRGARRIAQTLHDGALDEETLLEETR